jgi:Tfp pilus assembly protein PilN
MAPLAPSRLGVEVGVRTLRGVRLEGWLRTRARVVEVACDPANPAEAVDALREHLGPTRRIAVAIDVPLLFMKRVKLPPLGEPEKRNILRLEPERFFPVRAEEIVPAVRGDDDLVFAAKEAPLATWVAALEELGAVDVVEPGPLALARALAQVQLTGAVVLLDGQADGIGVVEIRDGRVRRARRVFGLLDDAAAVLLENGGVSGPIYFTPWNEDRVRVLSTLLPEAIVHPLPTVADVVGPFLPAYGAALGIGTKPNIPETLISPELGARITARWWRQLGLAVAASVAALVFALTSADAWRARATRGLEASLQSLQRRAAPALALQNQLQALGREAQAIQQSERERPDPLGVLLALSRQLPAGAYLRGIRWSGAEWQIDGYAPNTSRLVAQLGAAPEFKEVRFRSATTRAAVGDRTYENFALAFRYAPAP